MNDDVISLVLQALQSPEFVRANFGGPRRGGAATEWKRVLLRKLGEQVQFEYFDAKQSTAKNLAAREVEKAVRDVIACQFSSIHVTTVTESIDVRLSKKGKAFVGRHAVTAASRPASHNRTKAVPLPEGTPDEFLRFLGVADDRGRIRPSQRDKFVQINEFLKHFLHVWDGETLLRHGEPVKILDAGCGSSFLTLAVHHYLNDRLNVKAEVIGVDVNPEVIRRSAERVDVLGAEGVRFVCERIDRISATPDVVIALHACDTATDAALACGIKSGAKLILTAPCCHHHLNEQLTAEKVEVLRPVLRHGILRERQADLFTDAFRALLLRVHGYRTQVVEFVSPEHTARNLLIRAVKADLPPEEFAAEYAALKQFTGATPFLESLL